MNRQINDRFGSQAVARTISPERLFSPIAAIQITRNRENQRAAFGQERSSQLLGFLLEAAFFRVAFVQLYDHLLNRARHCPKSHLSAAVNAVGAFKRDHIALPVRAFGVRRGLCSLDRYKFVDLCHCIRFFLALVIRQCLSVQVPIYSKSAALTHLTHSRAEARFGPLFMWLEARFLESLGLA